MGRHVLFVLGHDGVRLGGRAGQILKKNGSVHYATAFFVLGFVRGDCAGKSPAPLVSAIDTASTLNKARKAPISASPMHLAHSASIAKPISMARDCICMPLLDSRTSFARRSVTLCAAST